MRQKSSVESLCTKYPESVTDKGFWQAKKMASPKLSPAFDAAVNPTFWILCLRALGVLEHHIIKVKFDRIANKNYHHNPELTDQYIRSFLKDKTTYYILLDEIQLVDNFEFVVNSLLYGKKF